jgi:hypothetical protein
MIHIMRNVNWYRIQALDTDVWVQETYTQNTIQTICYFIVRIKPRTKQCTTYIPQCSTVKCVLIAVDYIQRTLSISYNTFCLTLENYDIKHCGATDCTSYITNKLPYWTYTRLLLWHVLTYTVSSWYSI